MNIVFVGVQGAGKGAVIKEVTKIKPYDVIATGELFRKEIATGSQLGQKLKQTMDKGILVDLDTTLTVVKQAIKGKKNILFDAFPRNVEQAEAFKSIAKVDKVVYLKLDKQTAYTRLTNRLTCKNCNYVTSKLEVKNNICPVCGGELYTRTDDTREGIDKRFQQFDLLTLPMLEYYKQQGIVCEVDANRPLQNVVNDVLKVL